MHALRLKYYACFITMFHFTEKATNWCNKSHKNFDKLIGTSWPGGANENPLPKRKR